MSDGEATRTSSTSRVVTPPLETTRSILTPTTRSTSVKHEGVSLSASADDPSAIELKKRKWSEYSPEELELLIREMLRVIPTTGPVK